MPDSPQGQSGVMLLDGSSVSPGCQGIAFGHVPGFGNGLWLGSGFSCWALSSSIILESSFISRFVERSWIISLLLLVPPAVF